MPLFITNYFSQDADQKWSSLEQLVGKTISGPLKVARGEPSAHSEAWKCIIQCALSSVTMIHGIKIVANLTLSSNDAFSSILHIILIIS